MQTIQKPNKVTIPPDNRARFPRALDFVVVMLKHEHALLLWKKCNGDGLLSTSIICTTSTERPPCVLSSMTALPIRKASAAQPGLFGASKAIVGWTVRSPPSTASICWWVRSHGRRCRRRVLRMSSESACSPGRFTEAVPQRLRRGRSRRRRCVVIDSMGMILVECWARPRIVIQIF